MNRTRNLKCFIKFQKSKTIMEYNSYLYECETQCNSNFGDCEIVGREFDKQGNTILIIKEKL